MPAICPATTRRISQRLRWFPVTSATVRESYEFRTRSAQSGALETSGRRDGFHGFGRSTAVRRFFHEGRDCWGLIEALASSREYCALKDWRRERDSNPRYGFPYTRFPSVRLQPLGHLSGAGLLTASAGFIKGNGRVAQGINTAGRIAQLTSRISPQTDMS